MSTSTTYMGLVKPATTETADISVINSNMDTLDGHHHDGGTGGLAVMAVQSGVASAKPSPSAGQIYIATDDQVAFFAPGNSWVKLQNAAVSSSRIAEMVLSSAVSSITFSSIPQTFRHLELRWQALGTTANFAMVISFNSDTTAANYSTQALWASGTSLVGAEYLGTTYAGINAAFISGSGSHGAGGTISIPNYTGSFKKNLVSLFQTAYGTGTGNTYVGHYGGWWTNTAAITSITITASAGNMAATSIFTLIGHSPL